MVFLGKSEKPGRLAQKQYMKELHLHPIEKANQAFAGHKLIQIRKIDGQLLEPGFITIMYGDVAFRVQPSFMKHDSVFIRVDDIQDITFMTPEEEPSAL